MFVIIRFTAAFQLPHSSYLLDIMIYGAPSFSLPLLRRVTGLHWRRLVTWQSEYSSALVFTGNTFQYRGYVKPRLIPNAKYNLILV
jgi:hypothetical protein